MNYRLTKREQIEADCWNVTTFLAACAFMIATLYGCTPIQSAAEADYAAEQLACVDQSATRNEATACRNAVKARWAAKDGGDQ